LQGWTDALKAIHACRVPARNSAVCLDTPLITKNSPLTKNVRYFSRRQPGRIWLCPWERGAEIKRRIANETHCLLHAKKTRWSFAAEIWSEWLCVWRLFRHVATTHIQPQRGKERERERETYTWSRKNLRLFCFYNNWSKSNRTLVIICEMLPELIFNKKVL